MTKLKLSIEYLNGQEEYDETTFSVDEQPFTFESKYFRLRIEHYPELTKGVIDAIQTLQDFNVTDPQTIGRLMEEYETTKKVKL